MNNKTTPNQMRVLLHRMRGEAYVSESKGTTKHELSMRDMLKITRMLNEDIEGEVNTKPVNKKTAQDQADEEEKLTARLGDDVGIEFTELVVTDKYVFFGGTVNGEIQFVFRVTKDKETSGVQFNYLDDFNPDDEQNELIKKEIEQYFNEFYEYWMRNAIQKFDNEV